MRVTQGTFSYLPDFTEDEIKAQVRYCFDNGWAFSIEHTDLVLGNVGSSHV